MTGKAIAIAALTIALSAAAAAVAADPPAQPKEERQPLICRGGQKTLSSRIRTTRRCRTAEQWQREDDRGGLPISAQITAGQNDGRATAQPR